MLYLIETEEVDCTSRTVIEAGSIHEALSEYEKDWDPHWEIYVESIKITRIKKSSLRREE